MSAPVELNSSRQEELLREAVSRQTPLNLDCRVDNGWASYPSYFLGFDRASGDLVVGYPAGPEHLAPVILDGQNIGVAFRRGHRKCVFETQVAGRCFFSTGRADDVSALRLLWPMSVYELQRRLYYRTPVPAELSIEVEVWPWPTRLDGLDGAEVLRGRMLDISAGGLSILLPCEDNPHWAANTPVGCAFVSRKGQDRVELYGHTRYMSPPSEGEFRLGIQFVGLETAEESRATLDQILQVTSRFQQLEMAQRAQRE